MTKLSLFAAVATAAVASAASADLVAGWTMTTAVPAGSTGIAYTYGHADQGTADNISYSTLSSSHANTAAVTTYSSPSGNGSQYSFSSNNWAIGDFYEIQFGTVGSYGMTVSWDQTRSSTGPATFEALMSVDGGASWSLLGAYSVIQAGLAGSGTVSWSSAGAYQAAFNTTFSLGASADDQKTVLVRFASTVVGAATGTNRIDNIMVNNNIPSPGVVALLGVAGLVSRRRR